MLERVNYHNEQQNIDLKVKALIQHQTRLKKCEKFNAFKQYFLQPKNFFLSSFNKYLKRLTVTWRQRMQSRARIWPSISPWAGQTSRKLNKKKTNFVTSQKNYILIFFRTSVLVIWITKIKKVNLRIWITTFLNCTWTTGPSSTLPGTVYLKVDRKVRKGTNRQIFYRQQNKTK